MIVILVIGALLVFACVMLIELAPADDPQDCDINRKKAK